MPALPAFAALMLPLLAMAAPSAFTRVAPASLSAEARPSGPLVRLGDLLNDPTRASLSAEALQQADRLVVARLGMNARPFEISGRAIADTLLHTAPHLALQLPTLTHHERVRIVPAMQPTPFEPLLDQARNAWIERCVASGASDCTATTRMTIDTAALIPRGQVSYTIALPARLLDAPSETRVLATVRVDGIAVGTLQVQVDWQAALPAWRLRLPLQRNAAIVANDVDPVLASSEQIVRAAMRLDPRDGVLRATSDLSAGTLVPAIDPAMLAAVRVGDELPVRIAIGRTTASRRATALQDGRAGRALFVRFDDRDFSVATVPAAPSSAPIAAKELPQ